MLKIAFNRQLIDIKYIVPCLHKCHSVTFNQFSTKHLKSKYSNSVHATGSHRQQVQPLKYGCNPHQQPAELCFSKEGAPFEVLAGEPGYINVLDALLGWQLAQEAHKVLNRPAAASFKHLSPTGAALEGELASGIAAYCPLNPADLSPAANAYLRARAADPLSSYGDFAAISDPVDETLACLLKTEVSDGIIAPDYHPQALEILRAKKQHRFLVLRANPQWQPPIMESRDIFGVTLRQRRNDIALHAGLLQHLVTNCTKRPPQAIRDLLLSMITLKYTQSNSVGITWNGQIVGIGAGQQSRIDCTLLAGKKAQLWRLRQHPLATSLAFQPKVPRQQKVNALINWLDQRITSAERSHWRSLFIKPPDVFPTEEIAPWINSWNDVCLASDAFFPFRDNIDHAARFAVSHIVQPGGSHRDQEIIDACNGYGITMAHTGVRLFLH